MAVRSAWRVATGLLAACGSGSSPPAPQSGVDAGVDAAVAPPVAVAPAWGGSGTSAIVPQQLGHNAIWSRDGLGLWDPAAAAPRPDVLSLVNALRPGALRFPGGTRAMRYHFDEAIGPLSQRKPQCDAFTGTTDATPYGLAEFLGLAAQVGAQVTLVAPWADGSPQRAAAMVAYANGDPQSTVPLGKDADGVDWGTAGSWAAKRAQNGHPAPWGVAMIEIGNEPYSDLTVGPSTSCGRPGPFKQDERWVAGAWLPTTAADYATELAATAALVRAVDPQVRIGAAAYSSYDGVSDAAKEAGDVDRAGSGDPWNGRLVTSARDAFDVFVLHPYDLSASHAAVTLGKRLEKTIHDLAALAPDKGIAVTEYGSFRGGNSLMNVVLTADVERVAILAGASMGLRHVLIEDTSDEPFAASAAILGPSHTKQAGYEVMELLATTLSGLAIAVPEPAPDIEAMAARTPAGDYALLLVDRRADAGDPTALSVTLPAGTFHGALHLLSGDSLDATAVSRTDTPIASASGALAVTLPPNAVAVVELSSR